MNELFGRFCYIDTPWIAGTKTRYRIIGGGVLSNTWCEVPVTRKTKPVTHDYPTEVIFVVLDTLVGNDSIIRRFARKDIELIQAVDAAQVVHGRWVYKERHRRSYHTYTGFDAAGEEHTITVCQESTGKEPYCSNCGAQAAESFMDYCPKCGAKMDLQ